MQFVEVNYAINKTYFVEKQAFQDGVKNALRKNKFVKLVNTEIDIDKNGVSMQVDVELIGQTTFSKLFPELQDLIDFEIQTLINAKPKNVRFIITESK